MKHNPRPPTILNGLIAGFAGGIAWVIAMIIFFGPAQGILSNPIYQSEKFLMVMSKLDPLPRTVTSPWILIVGLLTIGMVYGLVYHFIRDAFRGKIWWKKGYQYGIVIWALMVPWFEFYLPWNVMHEPLMLALIEMALWMATLAIVGMAIARVYEWRNPEIESAP